MPAKTTRPLPRCLTVFAELLETRLPLAGNVTASINAIGDITILGDNLSNQISIQVTPGGELEISGVGTTVNGLASDVLPLEEFGEVHGKLQIRMRGGDDTVAIDDLDIFDRTTFRGGAGNDQVSASNIVVDGAAQFFGEAGNDTIELNGFSAVLSVITGSGDDVVMLTSTGTSRGNVLLNVGSGADQVDATNVFAQSKLTMLGGSGNDHFNSVLVTADRINVNLAAGDDFLHALGFIATQQDLLLGGGDDLASVHSAEFDTLSLIGGGGDDMLFALNAVGQQLSLAGAGGDDHLGISCGQIANLDIQAGGGDDWLVLGDPEIKNLSANTGAGSDLLIMEAASVDDADVMTGGGDDEVFYGSAASVVGTVNGNGGTGDTAWVDPGAVTVPELLSATVVEIGTDAEIDTMFTQMSDLWVARGGLLVQIQC